VTVAKTTDNDVASSTKSTAVNEEARSPELQNGVASLKKRLDMTLLF
jgi:hypothetical protein